MSQLGDGLPPAFEGVSKALRFPMASFITPTYFRSLVPVETARLISLGSSTTR